MTTDMPQIRASENDTEILHNCKRLKNITRSYLADNFALSQNHFHEITKALGSVVMQRSHTLV